MFFTQEDYKKIEQWLSRNAIKDTEFNNSVLPLKGNEEVTIIQDGHNTKLLLKDLVNNIKLLGDYDFINISESFNAKYISLQNAISFIPYRSRKIGQVITFLETNGNWSIYQFKGESLEVWDNTTLWVNVIESLHIDSILPDEEDLTITTPDVQGNVKMKFKDKDYNPLDFSGLGKVYLRKNIISTIDTENNIAKDINLLNQQALSKENTIYVIQYDFDLNGAEITIPEGCVLDFQGGSFSNGTVVGNYTNIKANCYVIFNNIIIEGLWRVNNIFLDWFNIDETEGADNYNSIRNCFQLSNDNIYNNIYLSKKTLYFSTKAYKDTEFGYIANVAQFAIKSNTTVHLDSTIILNPHELTHTDILSSTNTKNISIVGSGKIIGDVETHLGTTGEWCHGIHFYGVKNALIEGIVIEKNWGDGISLDSSAEVNINEDLQYSCENIIIRNVKSLYNRRQGLSIEGASNIEVCYSEFAYTGNISGTNPMAGIDIEPWRTNDTNKNIHVHHCNIHDNTNQNIIVYSANRNTENIIIENIIGTKSAYAIKADNVIFRNVDNVGIIALQHVNNINISNIDLEAIHVSAPSTNGNIYINNCNFNVDYSISSYYEGFISINSWQASINKLIVNNCEFIKGSNAPSSFNLVVNNDASNIIFKNSYIDFKDTPITLSCSFHNCHIKALKSITTINAPRTNEYFNNILEFSNSGYDIEYYAGSSATSETLKDIEIFKFVGNTFTNKLSTKIIHFNYWQPWTTCKITIEGNNIAGNAALGYIPTIIANTSIVNNIERNVGESSSRPTSAIQGLVYYDTTLNKPIWWTGEKWVDATGADA